MFEDWGEFYLVVGGAAAVLIGLIFVVITLMHDRPRSAVLYRIETVHGADPARHQLRPGAERGRAGPGDGLQDLRRHRRRDRGVGAGRGP